MTYTNFSSNTVAEICKFAKKANCYYVDGGYLWVVKYNNGIGFRAVKTYMSSGSENDLWWEFEIFHEKSDNSEKVVYCNNKATEKDILLFVASRIATNSLYA
jgi:hypothetical protein